MFIEKMMEDGLDKVESTKEMANYIPLEEEMFQEYGKEKKREKQRLIYYSQDYDYSNNELQQVMQFKIWARTNGLDLPDRDEEILRNLQARALDSQAAYDAMKFKHKY